MPDQDNRKEERYEVSWGLSLRARDWGEVREVTTNNVSRGGLYVQSTSAVPRGTRVHISLHLPDGSVFKVEGEVVHALSPEEGARQGKVAGFGIRFDAMYARELELLEAAAHNSAGRNAYPLEQGFITLAAAVHDLREGSVEQTSAHQLLAQQETGPKGPPAFVASRGDEPIFGIDFGTTYTSIAKVGEQRVSVLEDEEGNALTPSVVCYPEQGAPIVGWPAREKIVTMPATTLASPKRLLGRQYEDIKIGAYLASLAVRTAAGSEGEVVTNIYGETVTVEQVCSEVLRRVCQIGEHATGVPVRRAVLSAPVAYIEQREALGRAAALAGLDVVAIVDEPIAAAMAYSVGRQQDGLIAVYDFGVDTFDFTLLRVQDKQLIVLGEAGDAWLGGDDFDDALAKHASTDFFRRWKVDLQQRQVEWQKLVFLAEVAKRRLSMQPEAEIFAPGIVLSIRGAIDLRTKIDRELFAQLCGDLVDQSLEVVASCLELADVAPTEIDQVVLTGGVCRMPLVRERVQAYFEREARLTINPEQAIVLGNALYGHFLSELQPAVDQGSHE